jgi:hypothetical protein
MADSLFAIAQGWEQDIVTDEQRSELRNFIRDLVQYPCKIACKENNGSVDIYVLSEKKKKVTDWLELQPSGAIGVIFDEYEDPDANAVMLLSERCDDYNDENDIRFESDTESEGSE